MRIVRSAILAIGMMGLFACGGSSTPADTTPAADPAGAEEMANPCEGGEDMANPCEGGEDMGNPCEGNPCEGAADEGGDEGADEGADE